MDKKNEIYVITKDNHNIYELLKWLSIYLCEPENYHDLEGNSILDKEMRKDLGGFYALFNKLTEAIDKIDMVHDILMNHINIEHPGLLAELGLPYPDKVFREMILEDEIKIVNGKN